MLEYVLLMIGQCLVMMWQLSMREVSPGYS